MSNNTLLAEAINLPKGPATVLLAASDLAAILSEIKATRTELDVLREEVAKERAIDRRRIATLEREEPQPMQKDRGDILRALLAANGGKMLAKEARKRMHLSESRFSELLKSMDDAIEKRPYHLNRSAFVLILK
jgi:hypothetical protein